MTDRQNDVPAVILAGGLSRRMGGGDKSLLRIGDRSILSLAIERLAVQAAPVALNANGDPERFADFGLPVIADSVADHPGPLAGILAGLDWAAELGADRILTVAADTPFFPKDLASRLQDGSGAAPIALAATPHPERGLLRQPTFGLWSVGLRGDLRTALSDGVRRVVAFTDCHGAIDVIFESPPGRDPFFNVNRPEDLEEARLRAASEAT